MIKKGTIFSDYGITRGKVIQSSLFLVLAVIEDRSLKDKDGTVTVTAIRLVNNHYNDYKVIVKRCDKLINGAWRE